MVMKKIARFEKVSFEQFKKDWMETFHEYDEMQTKEVYDKIKLPMRATSGSAGYDFYSPVSFRLESGKGMKIPTGIRVKIEDGWVLSIFPRSGLGFKYRMQLDNTVGIIDSDYYGAANEGHIMIKFTNDSNTDKTIELEEGNAFAQGIFTEFGITYDDEASAKRNGGFGSTD